MYAILVIIRNHGIFGRYKNSYPVPLTVKLF